MNIGQLLDGLKATGKQHNTIIVLWGDHGWSFGEKQHWRKFALWQETTRMPFIGVAPGITAPGTSCDRTVDLMSVFPTLCELTELPLPEHVEGHSISSLLRDPKSEWRRPAITTHGYQNHAIRTEDWRYIRYADGSEELYDEAVDPYEWTNLAQQSQYASVRKELAAWLPTTSVAPLKKEQQRAKN